MAEADEQWPFCTLSRNAFSERMAEIRAMVAQFDGQAQATVDGAVLSFPPRDCLQLALAALVEKERQCCAMLRLSIEADHGSVRFIIKADGDERAAIQAFAGAMATGLPTLFAAHPGSVRVRKGVDLTVPTFDESHDAESGKELNR